MPAYKFITFYYFCNLYCVITIAHTMKKKGGSKQTHKKVLIRNKIILRFSVVAIVINAYRIVML